MSSSRTIWGYAGLGLSILTAACGIVGPPIAPEDVGVNQTIARQKAQLKKADALTPAENAAAAPVTPIEPVEPKGQDEELPSLRPVGTR